MITPKFTLRQDDNFVIVDMKVPGHVRLGEDDVWMEGRQFKFHAHPYFMRFVLFLLLLTHTHIFQPLFLCCHCCPIPLTASNSPGRLCKTGEKKPSSTGCTTD